MWLGQRTLRVEGIVAEHYVNIFPVGAIYLSVDNTNPKEFFGGEWERIAQGRALIGAGSIKAKTHDLRGTVEPGEFKPAVGQMGGEVNHTLSVSEMPSHNHKVNHNVKFTVAGTNPAGTGVSGIPGETSGWGSYNNADWYRLQTGAAGSGTAHNNMMPYLAIYVWQRTA